MPYPWEEEKFPLGQGQKIDQERAPERIPEEMLSIFTATPGTKPDLIQPGASSDEAETLSRLERQATRIARQYEPPVERSMAGEIGTSLARGALGIAKLPFEVAKIVGADVLGSQKVRRALEPILFGFEELAESRALRPSEAAGGPPIELDRIIENPGEVVRQIRENVTNPRFWAAQVPEGMLSMVPYFAGNLGTRLAGQALKYGKAIKAIQASEYLSDTEKAAQLAEIGKKLARLGSIGGFGAAMAMEAGEAESRLRQWEDQTGKRVEWAPRVLSILGSGLVSGGLEAISTERIFFGKHGAPPLEGMIRKLFEGKNGTILARKILDSVATEGITEGAQELVQNLAEKLGYRPDKKLTEGIVEAVLIGAAVGGLAGTGEVAHQAVRQYAPYMQELKRRAEEERIARLPEGFVSPRTGPTAAAGLAAMEAAARARAEEAARKAEEERIASLPETSPTYRTGPTPAAATIQPLPMPEQPSVPPMEELEADILREAPVTEPERTARPLDLTGKPMMPPEGRPLVQRLDALFRLVDETGDPRAAQEIHNLLLAHRPEVVEAFRSPDLAVGRGLRPLADRVEALYRKVEETGDVNAARQLHELLAANQRGLTQLNWEHLHRLASQPMTQSAGEIKDLVRDERLAGGEPEFMRRLETLFRQVDEEGDPRAAREIQSLITAHRPEVLRLFSLPEAGESRLGPLATRVEELYRRVEDAGDLDAARQLHELIRQNYHLLSRADRTISGLAAGPRPPAPEPEAIVPESPPTSGPQAPPAPPEVPPAPMPQAPPTAPTPTLKPPTPEAQPVPRTERAVTHPVPATEGRASKAITATGREVPTRFAVLDVDDLVTSHDDLLNENPAFPQELQPRDRTRAASELQISRIENNLRPELLGDNPLASDGAPIVGPDGIVESGNARTIALRRAYKANREQARRYKQWLIDHAAEFGLDPEAIKATQKPVLVRVRQGEVRPEERVVLAREFNLASTAAFSPMEQARNDARALLQTDILSLFEPNDRGEINTTANAPFIRAFMQRIVSPNELANYYTADGKLNQAGLNRIRNALFAAAYGKSGALELLAESTDDRLRNITGALAMVAPRMAKLEQQIRNGDRFDVGIAPQLAQAAEILQDIREAGLNFEDGLARVKFLGETDPLVVDLLHLFNAYARSRVRLQEVFNNYLDLADSMGTPKQLNLMNLPVEVSRADLLQKAISLMEERHGRERVLERTEPGREEPAVPSEGVQGEPKGPGVPGPSVEAASETKTAREGGVTAADIKRLYPDITDEQAEILASDPELRRQVAKGNWAAIMQQKAAEGVSDIGAQRGLPGVSGGLFAEPAPTEPSPAAKKQEVSDEEAERLYGERGSLLQKLPGNIGKARQEGRLTPRQLEYLKRIDEIEELVGQKRLTEIHNRRVRERKEAIEAERAPRREAERKLRVAPQAEAGVNIVTQAMVEEAFPGLEVRRARFFDGYRVLLPHQGLEIAVRLNGDILLPDAAALRAAGYSEEDIRGIQQNAEDYVLAGAWQVIDGGGIITLAKGEGRQTLRHEVFHAAADLVLTDKERQAILKEFGDWEAAARAYETWKPTEKPHSIFQKILDFFRQIWEAFRPTWEGTFRRIERGEVWQRRPREEDVFGEPIRYKVRGTANYEKTGNLPEDFVKTPDGSINFGEVDKEAAQIIRRQAGPVRLQVGKEEARSGFGLIHIKARHEKEILKLGYPNVESFIHDVAANYVQIRKGGGAALLLVKPNGLNKIAAIELTPGEAEDFYTIKSAWLGRPEYIEKFELLWERRVPVAAKPGIAPSLSSFPQGPEKGTPDAEGQSKLSAENIVSPGQKGKTPKYSLRPKEQEAIEAYREKYLAPTEPRESRDVVSTAKGLKDKLVEKAQRFYDQVVDRWAAWERLAERAVRAGAKVPHGEHITNALSFMRGVEGRVRQGLTGEYVYQDRMDFDPDLKEVVFTGDDLIRKGPSFNRRLEQLRELAKRRGQTVDEVMDDFEVFLVAQRDLELAGEFGNRMAGEIKGVHPEESKAVLAALTRKYGDDLRVLMDTGLSLLEWSDEMNLQPLLQVGFIDELTYKAIKAKNQFYAPFKRLLDQTNDYIAAHLAAQGVSSNVIKQIKGSEKQILSPLQTWIELAYKAQWAYARNKVYRAAYITGKAYDDAEVYEVPAKYVPVDFNQKQEIDAQLRQELLDLARELKVDVKVVATLRGRRLGEFSRMLKEEVAEGLISEELAGQIRLRFATSEKTLSHELGHAIDDQYDLVGLLIERGTPEMRRELRRIADQRASEADSKSFKRYVRKKTEQVAEFVNRYITDRETARAVAPETTAVFEQFLNQHDLLRPLLTFRPSARAGLMDFQNRVWARSPLPPEPGCVPYYRDGKRRWLKLPPDLYHAAQNLMPAEMGILMQIARIPADMLRSGAILVPEFSLGRNPIRDIIQAWIFSRFGFNPLKWFRDAYLLISKDPATMEFYRQWEAGGGPMATLAESFVEPEKITADYIKGKESQVKYFANPLHALRYASAYLENLTRFSIYKQAREKGLSHAEAIHEARRTTLDFSRAGGHPTVRYLNVTIPFWNASVQGMDKLATELTGPNRKAVARRLAMLAGVSVLIYLMARDDDRYKELEDWERNYFWHLPLGKNAPLIRIPKPFEAGILFGSVAERLVEALLTKDPKGVKSAMGAAWDAATPEIIPTIARPYIEAKANYDFFRGRPIEDIGLQRLPAGLRAKPWTTETAKAVGRLTDISPVQMEHFIRQWTGGLGANYFLPGIDLLLRKTGMVEDIRQPAQDKIQQVWGVRTFFTKPPTGWRAKSVNDFFERYQEVLLADQGWKTLWQSGDKAKLEKFLEEHPEAMYARVARKLMDEMSKVKKERQQVYASKALTPEQKREKLEALDARVVELARLGNAFMSTEAAATVKMPPSYRMEQGIRKPWRPEDYYELTARQTYEAFKQFQRRRWQDMDSDDRDALVETLLRKARREVSYEPKETGEEDKSSIAGLLVTKKKARDIKDQEASTLHDMLMQKEKRKKAQKFYEIGALL